jgi:hypothetical protein
MVKGFKIAAAVICIVCILAICIAPLADLPATSLRSYQMAVMLIWSLIAGASCLVLSVLKAPSHTDTPFFSPLSPKIWCIDIPAMTSCVLQC